MKKLDFKDYYGDLKNIPYFKYKQDENDYVLREERGNLPPEELWVGYGSSSEEYLLSGQEHMKALGCEINKLLPAGGGREKLS